MSPQFDRRSHRAQELLSTWTAARPWRASYWRALDAVRGAAPLTWPSAVYTPLEECGEVVAAAWRAHGREPSAGAIVAEAGALQGLAAWRLTRGVYRYDETLVDALRSTPLTGDLPSDVLMRLPEWAVYIETPGDTAPTRDGSTPLLGVMAWLDWVSATPRDPLDWAPDRTHAQLMLGLDLGTADLPISNVPLVGSLEDAIARTIDDWRANQDRLGVPAPRSGYATAARAVLPGLISRVLYLCADDADYADDRRPRRPQPVRTKHGYRLFPSDRLTVWDVGVRLGAALRRAQERDARESQGGSHASPRPHVRRAHWHTFLAGPKDRDRERRVKWLPPIPVNVEDVEALPATVHRVVE